MKAEETKQNDESISSDQMIIKKDNDNNSVLFED